MLIKAHYNTRKAACSDLLKLERLNPLNDVDDSDSKSDDSDGRNNSILTIIRVLSP